MLAAALAGVVAMAIGSGRLSGTAAVGAAAPVLLLLAVARRTRAGATRWAAGADGERSTGEVLERMRREGYVVLHDLRLPKRRANLDHLLVGPGGVFVVETKRWRGTVRVGPFGVRRHGGPHYGAIAQVRAQAAAVRRVVGDGVPVQACLCVQGASVRVRWWWPRPVARGVRVGEPDDLVHWLRHRSRRLDRGSVRDAARAVGATFVPAS